MKYISVSLALCINTSIQLHAMDRDKEPTKRMSWNKFLNSKTSWNEIPLELIPLPEVLITYNKRELTPQYANQVALEDIAELSFDKALEHFNKTLSPEDGYELFDRKNTKSDPYILFVYLLPEIKKKVLGHLELTSEAAQNKFLGMTVSKAFTYYAAHQNKQQMLPFDLYYSLNTLNQVKFIATIMCYQKAEFDEKYKFPKMPNAVVKAPEYATIMTKKITITKDVLWTHGIQLEKRVATVKDLCTPLCIMPIAPIGNDSPTILSRVTTLFRSNDYTSRLFHHE
jgi:antitoxin component of RelBE/YafQ-DinJ toxin-antitoxin module